jgi:hypothetical protein
MNLYRIYLGVRPSPSHPMFYEWVAGYLLLSLFADSKEAALNHALEIVKELPYECSSEAHCETADIMAQFDVVRLAKADQEKDRENLLTIISCGEHIDLMARQLGLGIQAIFMKDLQDLVFLGEDGRGSCKADLSSLS